MYPIVLMRFTNQDDDIFYMAWSPRIYSPLPLDTHPLLHPDYVSFLERITIHLNRDTFPSFNRSETSYGIYEDMNTEFHCPVTLDNRWDRAYFVTHDHRLISPLFFDRIEATNFIHSLRNITTILPDDLIIEFAEHSVL